MADETRPKGEPRHPDEELRRAEKEPYRRPALKSGERLEKTTLASCLTGPQFCGPYALEA